MCYNDDDHPVTEGGVANDEVAEESRMVSDVVVFQVIVFGITTDSKTDVVTGVSLEGAMLDRQHFVEELGDVESEGAVDGQGSTGGDLLGGAPGFGGKSEFQLVAVVVDVVGTANGAHARAVDVAEALEVVAHLALFGFELRLIAHGLPLAATANSEMRAARLNTEVGQTVEFYDTAFGVALFLLVKLNVDNIARHHKGYKHNKAVDFGNGLTFCACISDGYLLKQG